MRFTVGKCYEVILHGETKRFRVIRNESGLITVRICETGEEVDLMLLLRGDVSEMVVNEFDCMECDGQPTVPSF